MKKRGMEVVRGRRFCPARRDVGGLPRDVLTCILGRLDGSALRTARLACRAFRAASVPCVRALCHSYSSSSQPEAAAPDLLPHCLRVFPFIIRLELSIVLPSGAAVLQLSEVTSRLAHLKLQMGSTQGSSGDALRALAPSLAAAPRLTALEVGGAFLDSPNAGDSLAHALRACRSLEGLFLDIEDTMDDPEGLLAAALEAPSLRNLRFGHMVSDDLLTVAIRNTSRLTRLQGLDGVLWGYTDAEVNCIAALTQLTSLAMYGITYSESYSIQLSSLSALQVLRFLDGHFETSVRLLPLLRPMLHLRELHLSNWDEDWAGMDSLLASLPSITRLELKLEFVRAQGQQQFFPASYLPDGLRKLRHLDADFAAREPADVSRWTEAVTGLECLVLRCNSTTNYVFPQLPAMPRLTGLHFYETSSTSVSEGRPRSCRFLAGLPQLTHLSLWDMLDVERWDDHVGYLALLTKLTHLSLVCTEAPEAHGGAGHVSPAQGQPLTVLTHLAEVQACAPWLLALYGAEEGLCAVRHEMGLPKLSFICEKPRDAGVDIADFMSELVHVVLAHLL
eukprot:jgi/Botrbrau1/1153/Bobra.0162s0042.1